MNNKLRASLVQHDQLELLRLQAIEQFEHVEAISGTLIRRQFKAGDLIFELRFAEEKLAEVISRPLAHIEITIGDPDLVIRVLSGLSQALPSLWEDTQAGTHYSFSNPVYLTHHSRLRSFYESGTQALSIYDKDTKSGFYWIDDPTNLPYYLEACPMRHLLQWWLIENGMMIVHGGAVGTEKGGVLIGGGSGSGKSTSALICAVNGRMKYLGDDFVILRTLPEPMLFSLYNTGKLDKNSLQRFPSLIISVRNRDKLSTEKGVLYFDEGLADVLLDQIPAKAIILPQISESELSRIYPAKPTDCLRGLAPSTMFQFFPVRQDVFSQLSSLVRNIPGYHLELGADMSNVPDLIGDIISKFLNH